MSEIKIKAQAGRVIVQVGFFTKIFFNTLKGGEASELDEFANKLKAAKNRSIKMNNRK